MSLLDDPEKILGETDEILRLRAIIEEKEKIIKKYEEYFDYIHKKELNREKYSTWFDNQGEFINVNDLLK